MGSVAACSASRRWLCFSAATRVSHHALARSELHVGEPERAELTITLCTGDAVVVGYHAVFDDGQTIVIIDDCR
jgi:hypothetical protein